MGKKRDEQGERITALEQMVEAQAQMIRALERTVQTHTAALAAQATQIERLDRHAEAIKGLRKQVRTLAEVVETDRSIPVARAADAADAVDAGGGGAAAGAAVSGNLRQGEWTGQEPCLSCGKAKEAGREGFVTCKPCGTAYQRMARGPKEEKVTRSSCARCGAAKSSGIAPLCGPCKNARHEWEAARKAG